MQDKILFMIFNGEIKMIQNNSMDHREWFLSLGGNIDEYNNIIRGFVINNLIIFFKGNFEYNSEVMAVAKRYGPVMRSQLNIPTAKICCGILPGTNGSSWEPIVTITEEEILEYQKSLQELDEMVKKHDLVEAQQKNVEKHEGQNDFIEFKNDYKDSTFVKYATTFTLILIVATVLSKVYLVHAEKLYLKDRWSVLIVIAQIGLLIATMIFYNAKQSKAKYYGLGASLALFFTFNLPDVIIGSFNLFFTVDHTYIIKFMDGCKKLINKVKEKLFKKKTN